MQKYGLIVADNGSDMYITGTFDTRWNNDILNPAFSLLSASDFDVVALGWQPSVTGSPSLSAVSASPNPVIGGQRDDRHRDAVGRRADRRRRGRAVERQRRRDGTRERNGREGRELRDVQHHDVGGQQRRRW